MLDSGGANFINGMISIAKSNVQISQMKQMGNSVNALTQYKNQGAPTDQKAALQQFEGLFLGQLLRLMMDTVPVDKTFGGGFAEETYRGMMVDEYGMNISKSGGIGIAESLQKSLIDQQNIVHEAKQTIATADATARSYYKVYNLFTNK